MKTTLKTIALAGLLATGVTGLASAANPITVVHIAGAPAYRQDTIAAINYFIAHLPAGSGSAGETGAYNSVLVPSLGAVDPANAPYEQWYITNYAGSGTDVVISVALTGSAAGVESVASGSTALAQKFIPDANSTAALIGSPNNTGTSTFANSEKHVPDFALSDTFQNTTPYNGTQSLETGTNTFTTFSFSALTSKTLAIEPYVWVGSPGLAARGVTNITTAQAQNLYENGALPLSFFTGNSADQNTTVYGLTRDPGSGSRLIALAETGIGVTTTITTYQPSVGGSVADPLGDYVTGTFNPASIPEYPAGTIASTGLYDGNAGDTGYAKFGTGDNTSLLAAITSTQSGVASPYTGQSAYFITYFNPTDAAEAVTYGHASQLTYNGVAYTPANVAQGLYTFWSYEQAQYVNATLNQSSEATAKSVLNALAADWANATLSTGLQLSNIPVSRSVDGGTVSGL